MPQMRADDVKQLILTALPAAEVVVRTDDDTHFEAVVVTSEFSGQRSLQRHQMIYGALGSHMGSSIHALSIRAYTPEEWAAERGAR